MNSPRSELIQRATDGDPRSISILLNHYLQPRNIRVKVIRKENYLQILLQSETAIVESSTVNVICDSFIKIKPHSLKKVVLYAKRIGEDIPDWTHAIDLNQLENIEVKKDLSIVANRQVDFKIQAEDFRVAGEREILYGSLAIAGSIGLILLSISLGFILILLAMTFFWIKFEQGNLLGNSVKVSNKQFPRINQYAEIATDRLCMTMPNIFIRYNPLINASAMGFFDDKYTIVLNSALVEACDANEITFILGHELSHIKCSHTNYLPLTKSAENMVQIPVISNILGFVFLLWSRKCEYTCDRGGLIACGNLNASITALAKLTVGKELFEQMNLNALFDQRDEFNSNDIAKISELFETHPSIVHRIHELKRFYDSPTYRRLTSNFRFEP